MSWWDAWKHALAHPADNVVAATLVLIGAVLTVLGTLLASHLGRRAEAAREARDRILPSRTDAYIDARAWLTQWLYRGKT